MIPVIFLIFILVFVLIIYLIIEHMTIVVRRQSITLDELPPEFDGFSVLQISDLHHRKFGENQRKITEHAAALNPDIIAITGDLISRDQRDFTSIYEFCSSLSAIAPVYFSLGNHELDLPDEIRSQYFSALESAGVNLLLNSTCTISRGKSSIDITGASLDLSVYHSENFTYNHLNTYSVSLLMSDIGVRQRCTILLMHNPLIFDSISLWNADLILSGHVHGGVVRLPFIGGILSPERKFFPKYTKGLYISGCSKLYVSAGLGKLRFFNPPEINLLTLKSIH